MSGARIAEIVNALLLEKAEISSGEISDIAGISRQAAHRHLRALLTSGSLVAEGKGRGTRYRRPRDLLRRRYGRAGLSEDRAWQDVRAAFPALATPEIKNAAAVLGYAFTEMVNNAIDHSKADGVDVVFEIQRDHARFIVDDRGMGAFESVRAKLGLESHVAALQEISKGKVSTDPEHHTGEGIFFTSKMGDIFELEANELRWVVDNARGDHAIAAAPSRPGTVVRFELSLTNAKPPEAVFAAYTHDFEFDTSRAVIKLFEYGTRFVSRSEAKRLLVGLDRFREVILDFRGVEGVGQGFADEVFRVWSRAHPEVLLRAENMTVPVTFMVERARRTAETLPGT